MSVNLRIAATRKCIRVSANHHWVIAFLSGGASKQSGDLQAFSAHYAMTSTKFCALLVQQARCTVAQKMQQYADSAHAV